MNFFNLNYHERMSTKFHWNWSTINKMLSLWNCYFLLKSRAHNLHVCLTTITPFQHLKLIGFKCQYHWIPNYFLSNLSLYFWETATVMSDSHWLRNKNFVIEKCVDKFGTNAFTRNFELDEPRFEDEIYLPKLKFVLKAHGMDMS